ncbi:MAG: Alw26I/Eco31I/Esp3I family type II restriction adenine-specific DNA-methyltransferase [Clostridia bacterium]|nr:Alw26I/Eco31I/Esp3I family type II restriction adenine-specific DNA-methyltransferase [Clostridia bacterium]
MLSIKDKIAEIEAKSLAFENSIDPLQRKQTGSYYTSLELTIAMMEELVVKLPTQKRERLYTLRFLEPCVGTGNFIFAYLLVAQSLNFTKEQYHELIENIYVCDINIAALSHYKNMLRFIADACFGISLTDEYFEKHIGGGVLFDVNSSTPHYIALDEVFGNGFEHSFDIIATNPPYKNLKAERSHYPSEQEHEEDKKRYASITDVASGYLRHSISGVVNLYKLFVEEIVERYAAPDAEIALLIPSSILTDKTCEKLRSRILDTSAFLSIKAIAENNRFVDAQQALCAILLRKGVKGGKIDVSTNYGGINEETVIVSTDDVLARNNGNMLLTLKADEYDILHKMNLYPKIKDLDFIVNMRGELDLTVNKTAITTTITPYPLLRGRNIGFYELLGVPSGEYVMADFVESSAKKQFVAGERIICQQISNMAKERRLTFTPIPENYVLGNSCNFITVSDNEFGIDMWFLLGILNSSLMNWYFKLQSSNNHINNYEIDSFPIPIAYPHKAKLAGYVMAYIRDNSQQSLIDEIDALVREIYLSECTEPITPFERLVQGKIEEKHKKLSHNCILNHTTFKLSDLDLEMVRAVPQGGSWKDIPQETVQKSKRLIRINQTGGRTTLYGRIDYTKPSYTITTYFNRPGNGTYVHPIHDRVISVREAARLQSFPDSYYFCGNKTQLLNQVGNAVPPILAYQIAKKIMEAAKSRTSLDLFCGAGGMTYGFKLAGIKSMLGNDIEESACVTLKVNNPEIDVLCGDVTDSATKDLIVNKAKGVDIVCGGPPCQGFSMAGYRLTDDPRNQLFHDFIEIVARVTPKVVVFENVEGMLTFQGGATYRCIHEMFGEIGYNTKGRVLLTSLYGVPQRRKRVIVICTRKDLSISPSELYPQEITADVKFQITAHDAIYDLQNISCSEEAIYHSRPMSLFAQWAHGEIAIKEYIATVSQHTKDAPQLGRSDDC